LRAVPRGFRDRLAAQENREGGSQQGPRQWRERIAG
ncbi:MAG: hypothetical protein JWN87_857, partial [Frankiales bacterium]|nr:hypothetical protein [Frankiales bacterium]